MLVIKLLENKDLIHNPRNPFIPKIRDSKMRVRGNFTLEPFADKTMRALSLRGFLFYKIFRNHSRSSFKCLPEGRIGPKSTFIPYRFKGFIDSLLIFH